MNNLQKVFHDFAQYSDDILILLDESFCFPKSRPKNKKKYVSITSLMDEDDVYECLKEEGSTVLNYKITSKGMGPNKILNYFIHILVNFDFQPYIVELPNNEVIVSIVASDVDVGFQCQEVTMSDDDDYQEDVEATAGEEEDYREEYEDEHEDEHEDKHETEDEHDGEKDVCDYEVEVEEVEEEGEDENEDDDEIDENEGENKEGEEEDEVEVEGEEEEGGGEVEESEGEDEVESDDKSEEEENPVVNELRGENLDKMKKPEMIDYLLRLNIKKVNDKNIRICQKHELGEFLKNFLEN